MLDAMDSVREGCALARPATAASATKGCTDWSNCHQSRHRKHSVVCAPAPHTQHVGHFFIWRLRRCIDFNRPLPKGTA